MNAHAKGRGRTPKTDADGRIRELAVTAMGSTAIALQLRTEGYDVSDRTVARRLREIRGPRHHIASAAPSAASSGAAAVVPEEVPENVDPSTLDTWLATLERKGQEAAEHGDFDTFAKCGRLSMQLLDLKRKITPPAAANPEEDPDMVKLADEVWARLHKMIDQVVT